MSRRGLPTLAPLKTLYETKLGKTLALPPELARLYGRLRMPLERSRPHVISNFVTTLDGVVSLNVKEHASAAIRSFLRFLEGHTGNRPISLPTLGRYPVEPVPYAR